MPSAVNYSKWDALAAELDDEDDAVAARAAAARGAQKAVPQPGSAEYKVFFKANPKGLSGGQGWRTSFKHQQPPTAQGDPSCYSSVVLGAHAVAAINAHDASNAARCASVVYQTWLRYWVPRSPPCRLSVVGS